MPTTVQLFGRVTLLALVFCAGVNAQNTAAALEELKQAKVTLWPQIVEIAGATNIANDPKSIWTAFTPTDAAIQAFLKDMGLTWGDLKARPGLAEELIGTHVTTAGNLRFEELFADGRSARILQPVGGRANDLLFTKAADGKVTVTGPRGVTAIVNGKHIAFDKNKTVHVIDKVLYGESYYPSFAALCKERDTAKDFCHAAAYAGVLGTMDSKDFAHTVLVPNNAAFTGLGLNTGSAPSQSAVADILKYHVLAGPPKALPEGIEAGPVSTLAGQPLTVKYAEVTEGGKPTLEATFTSTDGTTAKVLRSDIYVGKSIVNGIDKVLMPKAAAPATQKTPTGRRLLYGFVNSFTNQGGGFTNGQPLVGPFGGWGQSINAVAPKPKPTPSGPTCDCMDPSEPDGANWDPTYCRQKCAKWNPGTPVLEPGFGKLSANGVGDF